MTHAHVRVAVVGHVEHVTVGRVAALPAPGEIAHLDAPRWLPGGGGGIAFFQLANGPGEVHLFTALGNDDAAREVEERLDATGAHIHAARREEPHTRDVVMVTPSGERTIVVGGEPLHPARTDDLPWNLLAGCDAVYFTAQDPDTLGAARAARLLVVTARRAEALARSRVQADVVVGSSGDTREAGKRDEFTVPPRAVVMTEGEVGGSIETPEGSVRFPAPRRRKPIVGAYGAGDTFAGALTWFLACGVPLADACARAAVHGAAVLSCLDPLECQTPLE